MNVTRCAAAAAVSAGLSGLIVGIGIACADQGADQAAPASAVRWVPPTAPGSSRSVLASPRPTDIGWSWDWDDDDEDWSQTASWDCPAGCSITWEDW
jgi:hypothetical protein